jgi:glycosyltransferase involved in cell wall biosynthesis
MSTGKTTRIEPLVTLIVPCRNEAAFIRPCLDSVACNDYPNGRIEVFILDGMSRDGTREIIGEFILRYPHMVLLDNVDATIPAAMNIGIRRAKGSVIMKIDAHAVYPADYIRKCVAGLEQFRADNVGGVITAVPRDKTLLGRSIVISLSSIFGVGSSTFRIGCDKPMSARTTYSGCYRRDVFERIGLYDEHILRSEDVVLNTKLLKAGGKIIVDPGIVVLYYARTNFGAFIRHNFDNGFWVTYPLRYRAWAFSLRHLIPLIFVVVLLGSSATSLFVPAAPVAAAASVLLMLTAFAYAMSSLYYSAAIALKQKDVRFLLTMPLVFLVLHLGYGLGSILGFFKIPADLCAAALKKAKGRDV